MAAITARATTVNATIEHHREPERHQPAECGHQEEEGHDEADRPPRTRSSCAIRPTSSAAEASPTSCTVKPGSWVAAATRRSAGTFLVASLTLPATTVGTKVVRRSGDTIEGSWVW